MKMFGSMGTVSAFLILALALSFLGSSSGYCEEEVKVVCSSTETLTARLIHEDASIRKRALADFRKLSSQKQAEASSKVLDILCDDDPEGYCDYSALATEALTAIGRPAIPPLINLIKAPPDSPYFGNRDRAIDVLSAIGVPADQRPVVVELLVKGLNDQSFAFAVSSSRALTRIGAPAVQPLIDYLETETNDKGKKLAVEALGAMGAAAEGAIPALVRIISDNNGFAGVVQGAAKALTQIGGKRFLKDPRVVLQLLWHDIQNFHSSSDRRQLSREIEAHTRILGPAAAGTVPALQSFLKDSDPEVLSSIRQALKNIGTPAPPPAGRSSP